MSIVPLRDLSARPDPRTFCGGAWPQVRELVDGRDVVACFLVHDKQRKETKSLKPYLHLVLGDRTGTIDAKIWDDAAHFDRLFTAEDVHVRHKLSGGNVLVIDPAQASPRRTPNRARHHSTLPGRRQGDLGSSRFTAQENDGRMLP